MNNPHTHVVLALLLAFTVAWIAGDDWSTRVAAFVPIRPRKAGEQTA